MRQPSSPSPVATLFQRSILEWRASYKAAKAAGHSASPGTASPAPAVVRLGAVRNKLGARK